MASKGQKFKYWTAEEKYKIIKPALDLEESITNISKRNNIDKEMIGRLIRTYHKFGMDGLTQKKKQGNSLCKYQNKTQI